jgi:hypothetical protein
VSTILHNSFDDSRGVGSSSSLLAVTVTVTMTVETTTTTTPTTAAAAVGACSSSADSEAVARRRLLLSRLLLCCLLLLLIAAAFSSGNHDRCQYIRYDIFLFCFVFFVLCLSVSLLFFTRFHFKFEDIERYVFYARVLAIFCFPG